MEDITQDTPNKENNNYHESTSPGLVKSDMMTEFFFISAHKNKWSFGQFSISKLI